MRSGTDTPSRPAPQRLDMYSVRCPTCDKVTQMDDVHTCSPQQEQAALPAPKTGTCGHPALFTWHYTGYQRVPTCLYCAASPPKEAK
jgi:hypothetical protein